MQIRLHALGYYNGPFSGYYSEDVQAAVTAFQQDTGLTADGIFRPDTLACFSTRNKRTAKNAVLKRTASLFLCFISPRCWNSWGLPW
ncbi:MAG: peptidoglycan-binding protein [Clostridia bacterium]|nr:peptidoglycan-binding protein [Clostridia bacterium]